MKYRNYFILFAVAFAVFASWGDEKVAIANYLIFALPTLVMMIAYLIIIFGKR